jgi:16S rRNA (guanine966-N2)-methyltransferase
MIRLTGGQWARQSIESPPNPDIRPTTGKVRESLFGHLGERVLNARFLDLFAGSGLMGLEALSREATFVLAIDINPRHIELIRRNMTRFELTQTQALVLCQDAWKLTTQTPETPFDLIFLDPPYGFIMLENLVAQILEHGWLSPDGLLIVEQGTREPELPNVSYIKSFGDTRLSFMTPSVISN